METALFFVVLGFAAGLFTTYLTRLMDQSLRNRER